MLCFYVVQQNTNSEMQKLKIAVLLEGLSSGEIKRLGDFIRSPFYNKNKNLVLLYEFFRRYLSASDPDGITKEKIWEHLCREKKYDDSKLRSVLSDFKKLCETFFTVIKHEEDPLRQKNFLLDALSEKKSFKKF